MPLILEPMVLHERKGADRVEIDLLIPEALYFFQGHFPDYPVLPGVVQLHWSIALGRRYFSLGASSAESVQVKFRSIIVPGATIRLTLSHDAARRKLSFEYRDAEAICSSGLVTFAA